MSQAERHAKQTAKQVEEARQHEAMLELYAPRPLFVILHTWCNPGPLYMTDWSHIAFIGYTGRWPNGEPYDVPAHSPRRLGT